MCVCGGGGGGGGGGVCACMRALVCVCDFISLRMCLRVCVFDSLILFFCSLSVVFML